MVSQKDETFRLESMVNSEAIFLRSFADPLEKLLKSITDML